MTIKELFMERYKRGRPQLYGHQAFNSWPGMGARYEHYKRNPNDQSA